MRCFDGRIDDPTFIPDGYPDEAATYDGMALLPFEIVPHYRSDHPESGIAGGGTNDQDVAVLHSTCCLLCQVKAKGGGRTATTVAAQRAKMGR